ADSKMEITSSAQDSFIFNEMIQWWQVQSIDSSSWSQIIPTVASYWMGTPYLANTLEVGGDEHLVVNLREMDCTTYVEYVLAISTILKLEEPTWDDFTEALVKIRYRNGAINGYNSRLHYFTEWLQNKVENGTLILISDSIGDSSLNSDVRFMSENPQYYRQLKNDSSMVENVRQTEKTIAKYRMRQITKEKIPSIERYIKNGDIIALVSTVNGLDVSHVGFAQFVGTRLHFLHASTTTKQVELTKIPLSDYLRARPTVTGILVGRMK
ncbi:MAG TPA: N-acetylmuramoyl-L-alanine amidase-like domain-containing protein, partial [Marinilabiliaceae bacterium]|nr:N-acetylmuramoyl-L-alanine amidase-like domain-containing protein [Marinilabiliaceae bacterium]